MSSITVKPYALGREQSITEFNYSGRSTLTAGDPTDETYDSVQVDVRTGDELIASGEVPAPTVLKVDVEGHELRVFEGFAPTLESSERFVIYCEIHLPAKNGQSIEDLGGNAEDPEELLESYGSDITVIHERKRDYHIKAEK